MEYFAYLSSRGPVDRSVSVTAIRTAESKAMVRELPNHNRLTWLIGWAPDGQSLIGIGVHEGQ